MTQTKRKLGKEILSFILVLSMVVSGLPLTAFAETEEEGLSKYHTEHTPECGYVEAVEGQPCTHEHTDDCYSIVKCVHEHDKSCGENGDNCTHICSEDSGCITVKLNCHHTHDESCGYIESKEGTPCNHVHDEECGYIEAVEEVLCDCTDTDENGEIIHTEGCGYVEAVEGSPCTHIHDETCGYAEAVEGTPCNHICSIEEGCYELVCSHAVEGQHDDTCGYVEAVEGSPCKYEYEEEDSKDSNEEVTESTTEEENTENIATVYTTEEVKAMIDALPDVSELESMSNDELNSVYEQAQDAYDAFEALTDEAQMKLADELVKLRAVLDFMTTLVTPLATEADTLTIEKDLNYIAYSDGVSQYFTYNNRLYKITYTNLSWSMVKLATFKYNSKYALRINSDGQDMKNLLDNNYENLYTTSLPTTQGAELICYSSSGKVATITCLELNENPTWNWASDYSSASVVFKAKNYDVQATVNAGMATKITNYATKCTENNTVEYTASVSFGGSTYTETKTAANGAIGPHSFTYSASGNVITESCSNSCGHKETATLTVDPSVSLLYTGSEIKPLKIEYSADWKGGELSISYDDDCVSMGTHSGSITVGGVKATQDFVITTSALVTEENYKSLGLDSSYIGYYTISTLVELDSFSALTTQNSSANAVLLSNIDMENSAWSAIGTKDKPYTGTFDGNGKTLSNLSITATGDNQGLFGVVSGGTIKNFTIKGKISVSETSESIGGVAGTVKGSATINGVTSYVTISDTRTGNTTSNSYVGGIVGYMDGSTITNSSYYGEITLKQGGSVAGIAGEATGSSTINQCNNNGKITSKGNSAYVGGILGHSNNVGSLKNCYNYGNITSNSDNHTGAIVGWCESSDVLMISNNYYLDSSCNQASGGTAISDVYAKTSEEFKSGEVTYLLNNGVTNGTQIWYQTIGTDDYPKFTGKTVYGGYICGSGTENRVYQNNTEGILDTPHAEHEWGDDGNCIYCHTSSKPSENNGVYEIKNLGHLQWFADYVNAGNTNINGKLMADIDASSLTSLAIGISGKAYSGTFDGNGYTLTIALDSTEPYVAPFQYVNGATIKNLTVTGTINTSNQYAASIVSLSTGSTTIENCLSSVVIESTRSGDGTHGGLVANVSSETMTINNCGFVGAINGSNTTNCGGLVGWANSTTNISNSFVAATFSLKSGDNYTFSRNASKVSLTNCYYINALGTAQGIQITTEQLTSGKLAWLLNGSDNGTWKQTIGTDNYPNFSGSAIYKTLPCESYTNNEAEKTKEHDFNEQGFCKDCNGYQPAVWNNTDNVYEISNAGQLMWFAGLVNGTLDDMAQNQSASAVLKNDLDMSGITSYVPIGGTTGLYYKTEGDDKGYRGTFDGNGYVIKNLSVTGSNTAQLTYGVFGTLCGVVKHLGVENFTFTLGSQDCRAGGIVGQMLSGGLVEDCYVANSTITAKGKVAGGIAGCNYAGTIQNCFTYKVTVTATRSGGIVGDNRGDNSTSDRLGTVSNCYTDAGSVEGQAGTVTSSTSGVSVADFESGKIAYLLNGSTSDGSLVWYQTCGAGYPAFSGETVYANVSCNGYTYANTQQAGNTEHSYVNGFCQYCDAYQPAVKNNEDYYEISNAGQLYWFAALTNGELNGITQDASANAILLNDIIVNTGVIVNGSLASNTNGFRNWTPIGNYNVNGKKDYNGIFEGNGHTISGLYMLAQVSCSGFIGSNVSASAIRNIIVADSYFTSTSDNVGAITGYNDGGTIERCASVNCIISGQYFVGGIAGMISGGTISNCYSSCQITASAGRGCGIGVTQYTCTISNCYFMGSIKGPYYKAAITYVNNDSANQVTVNDCYYISTISVGAAKVGSDGTLNTNRVEAKTEEQFSSGEVAWLLNGSSSTGVWKQTIGSDDSPNFSGLKVYYDANATPNYYNEQTISVQITWTEMEFTYTDGEWNPETHNYENAGWIAADGAGVITAKNTGNVTVDVSFKYTQTISGISGSFTNDSMMLNKNEADTTKFGLNGEPSTDMDCSELGMITVTVKKHEDE